MQLNEQAPREAAEENIIPLINVVFLLLIFFLLVGTLAPKPPFELEPAASNASPKADMPEGALYISAGGQLFYRGHMLTLDKLAAAVRGVGERKKPLEVLTDRRLKAGTLFPVIETLGRAGITRIRLLTERNGQ